MFNGAYWTRRFLSPNVDPMVVAGHGAIDASSNGCVPGLMRGVLEALALDLEAGGKLDLQEAFIDGSFAPAQKEGYKWAKPIAARGARSRQWQTALVFLSRYARLVLRRMK